MSRRPLHLVTALGLALLSLLPLAAAQPDPRAAELLDALDRAMLEDAASEAPRTYVVNLYMRLTGEAGTGTHLMAMAYDFQGERAYMRSCIDGGLAFELAFREGTLYQLDPFSSEVTSTPADADEIAATFRQMLQDPTVFLGTGYDTARYDGYVDYGVVAGEQVSTEIQLPGQPLQRIAMLFGPEGDMVGSVTDTPEGRAIGVVDGFMRVERGLVLRGMTLHLLLEDGTRELGTLRFWRPRTDVVLDDALFVLEPRSESGSSTYERRAELMDRILAAHRRMAAEVDMPREEYEALSEEVDALMEELDELPPFSFDYPDCPGPL